MNIQTTKSVNAAVSVGHSRPHDAATAPHQPQHPRRQATVAMKTPRSPRTTPLALWAPNFLQQLHTTDSASLATFDQLSVCLSMSLWVSQCPTMVLSRILSLSLSLYPSLSIPLSLSLSLYPSPFLSVEFCLNCCNQSQAVSTCRMANSFILRRRKR